MVYRESMAKFIEGRLWREALRRPDWYLELSGEFRRLEKLTSGVREDKRKSAAAKSAKLEAYELVEDALETGSIPLAGTGEDFDRDRRPPDTVVIHHTKNSAGLTLSRLNAMHLLRLYAPRFAAKNLAGRPVWSNHFRSGRQVFYAYHWLVRQDGSCERLLEDKHIGWHAGCWHVNTRSIAVAIDDDLTDKQPSQTILDAIAKLLKNHYPDIPSHLVIGHCEIFSSPKAAACPGELFLTGWKQSLLGKL